MRGAALLSVAAVLLYGGASAAQTVDPRTAAGAAGEITGQVTPGVDTPAEIDPTRDPAAQPTPPRLPDPSALRRQKPAPPPSTVERGESSTSTPGTKTAPSRDASEPAPARPLER